MQLNPIDIRKKISEKALDLGFSGVAFSEIEPFERGRVFLKKSLLKGYMAEMSYMDSADKRADPKLFLKDAKSIVVVAMAYPHRSKLPIIDEQTSPYGFIARYARGPDYHIVMKKQLKELAHSCYEWLNRPVLSRICVDSGYLLEKEIAHHSGLAFIAKNTLAIMAGVGSYILLGELLLDIEIPQQTSSAKPKCGACTACLDACPTQAFVSEYTLDARRCISYLTIEHKGIIPREYRRAIGNMIFGCDICQEVCPYNSARSTIGEKSLLKPYEHLNFPLLDKILNLRSGEYRRFVKKTALRRVNRHQLARNAAIALGNSTSVKAVNILQNALHLSKNSLVRGHIVWALGEKKDHNIIQLLKKIKETEKDLFVLDEINHVLNTK